LKFLFFSLFYFQSFFSTHSILFAPNNINYSLKDIEREFERSKKELGKKWEQILEERAEVNEIWMSLKDSIDNFE